MLLRWYIRPWPSMARLRCTTPGYEKKHYDSKSYTYYYYWLFHALASHGYKTNKKRLKNPTNRYNNHATHPHPHPPKTKFVNDSRVNMEYSRNFLRTHSGIGNRKEKLTLGKIFSMIAKKPSLLSFTSSDPPQSQIPIVSAAHTGATSPPSPLIHRLSAACSMPCVHNRAVGVCYLPIRLAQGKVNQRAQGHLDSSPAAADLTPSLPTQKKPDIILERTSITRTRERTHENRTSVRVYLPKKSTKLSPF